MEDRRHSIRVAVIETLIAMSRLDQTGTIVPTVGTIKAFGNSALECVVP